MLPDESSERSPHGPRRTCVVCREEADRDKLIRLACSPDGIVVFDLSAKLPGRGAWIHPSRDCAEKLQKQSGLLRRHFERDVSTENFCERLILAVHGTVLDGLSIAAASGALVGGFELLSQEIREQRVVAIVLAKDASERTIKELLEVAGEIPFTTLELDKDALGERIGRGSRAAVGVMMSRSSAFLLRRLRWLRQIRGE